MALVTAATRRLVLVRESWLRTAAKSTAASGCLRGFSTHLQRGCLNLKPSTSTQPQRGCLNPSTQSQPQRGCLNPSSSTQSQLQRGFATSTQPLRSDNKVTVHFINRDGEKIIVKGSPGESLLDIVIEQDLDFDGFGACEGTLACSTCHLIFDEEVYKQLGPVTDEEMDMLDLAYGLTDTSRLGCQICLTKSMEGMVARVPESVADIRQSGDGSS